MDQKTVAANKQSSRLSGYHNLVRETNYTDRRETMIAK